MNRKKVSAWIGVVLFMLGVVCLLCTISGLAVGMPKLYIIVQAVADAVLTLLGAAFITVSCEG